MHAALGVGVIYMQSTADACVLCFDTFATYAREFRSQKGISFIQL